MADLLTLIYSWFYSWFIDPIINFLGDFSSELDPPLTPIVITMPGSDIPLITTNLSDLFYLGGAIFLCIGSIICFIGLLKLFYKMGRRLFGGRR